MMSHICCSLACQHCGCMEQAWWCKRPRSLLSYSAVRLSSVVHSLKVLALLQLHVMTNVGMAALDAGEGSGSRKWELSSYSFNCMLQLR